MESWATRVMLQEVEPGGESVAKAQAVHAARDVEKGFVR
jgi:hypothetical protein